MHSLNETMLTFRAFSSVGLEHLPYKQGVIGSNPTRPTEIKTLQEIEGFFYFYCLNIIHQFIRLSSEYIIISSAV